MSSETVSAGVRRSSQVSSALEREAWPKLGPAVVEQLRAAGYTRDIAAGDVLFELGQDHYDLVYIESGSVAIVDRADDRVVTEIMAGDFVGELGMLMGQRTFYAGVAASPGRVITVTVDRLRDLIATVPEVGDPVITAFAARRRLLASWEEGGLVIVGDAVDPVAARLRTFAVRNVVPHRWVDRHDTAAIAELRRTCELPDSGPAVVTGHGDVLVAPTPRELAVAIGMDLAAGVDAVFDVIIIGAGPAGLAAAVYGASEGLNVIVVDDTAVGGQAGTSSRIENYLGFPAGVSGADLAGRAFVQAVKFGARIVAPRRATALRQEVGTFTVTLDDDTHISGRTVVLAGGVQYRALPIAGLAEFDGRGVYYAATDLEARSCRDVPVVVIGGGNSAGQAAMYLSRHAARVHMLVRGRGLSETMSSYLSQRIEHDPRIALTTRAEVVAVHGTGRLEQVTVRHRDTGREDTLATEGLFVMIGAAPQTGWLDGQVMTDRNGFVCTGPIAGPAAGTFETSVPGVFAVGDMRAESVKRVASSVGEGSVVISSVHGYLSRTSAS